MENTKSESIKKFEAELEKVKKGIYDITCHQKTQEDVFKQELDSMQEKLAKIRQIIDKFNIDTLEAAVPKYFKIKEPYGAESGIEVYKTKNILFEKGNYRVFANKLFFNYDEATGQFTLYSKQTSDILGCDLDVALNRANHYFQEITEEEYNEGRKKAAEAIMKYI